MIAVFPEIKTTCEGEPHLLDIVRALLHIIECAQSHDTDDADHNGLNMLHVALEDQYYRPFLTNPNNQAHPGVPPAAAAVPVLTPVTNGGNQAQWNVETLTWDVGAYEEETRRAHTHGQRPQEQVARNVPAGIY